MELCSSHLPSWNYLKNSIKTQSKSQNFTFTKLTNSTRNVHKESSESFTASLEHSSSSTPSSNGSCCARRHFLGSVLGTGFLPISPSFASNCRPSPHDPMSVMNRIHPPKPDWYEEFFASAMDKTMDFYEAEIAGYKSQLFAKLRGNADKILEIGMGSGPNLKYYADYPGVNVFGVDPNRKMEKYARASAEAVGLPQSNFTFVQAVAEALPLDDASIDAVVGTLVLCSVNDVDQTLKEVKRVLKPGGLYIFVEHVGAKDGTLLRFIQQILDPLQQTLADGCHLCRDTSTNIARAGFADLDVNHIVVSSASYISPHVYGIARL